MEKASVDGLARTVAVRGRDGCLCVVFRGFGMSSVRAVCRRFGGWASGWVATEVGEVHACLD